MSDSRIIYNKCLRLLSLDDNDDFTSYYSSIGLCALDSVFSINARYSTVINVLNRLCGYFEIKQSFRETFNIPELNDQYSTEYLLNLINQYDAEILAEKILKNKQRTSTSNGILKAQAWIYFLEVLKETRINTYQDIHLTYNDPMELQILKSKILKIRGQGSGVSFDYFLMLCGITELFKPDRMVQRFLSDELKRNIVEGEIKSILEEVLFMINEVSENKINMRHLDYLIWKYQSSTYRKLENNTCN